MAARAWDISSSLHAAHQSHAAPLEASGYWQLDRIASTQLGLAHCVQTDCCPPHTFPSNQTNQCAWAVAGAQRSRLHARARAHRHQQANCCCFIDPNLGFPTWVAQPTPRAARARAPAAPARARHGKRVRRRHRRGAEPPHQGGHSGGASCGVGPLRPHPPVLAAAPIAPAPRSTMQRHMQRLHMQRLQWERSIQHLCCSSSCRCAGRARMGRQCAWAEPMLGIRHPKLAKGYRG